KVHEIIVIAFLAGIIISLNAPTYASAIRDLVPREDTLNAIALNSIQYNSSRVRGGDRKSTRLNSSHGSISYAVFCLKKKKELVSNNIVEHDEMPGGIITLMIVRAFLSSLLIRYRRQPYVAESDTIQSDHRRQELHNR